MRIIYKCNTSRCATTTWPEVKTHLSLVDLFHITTCLYLLVCKTGPSLMHDPIRKLAKWRDHWTSSALLGLIPGPADVRVQPHFWTYTSELCSIYSLRQASQCDWTKNKLCIADGSFMKTWILTSASRKISAFNCYYFSKRIWRKNEKLNLCEVQWMSDPQIQNKS